MCPQPECQSEKYTVIEHQYKYLLICKCAWCGKIFIKLKEKK